MHRYILKSKNYPRNKQEIPSTSSYANQKEVFALGSTNDPRTQKKVTIKILHFPLGGYWHHLSLAAFGGRFFFFSNLPKGYYLKLLKGIYQSIINNIIRNFIKQINSTLNEEFKK